MTSGRNPTFGSEDEDEQGASQGSPDLQEGHRGRAPEIERTRLCLVPLPPATRDFVGDGELGDAPGLPLRKGSCPSLRVLAASGRLRFR